MGNAHSASFYDNDRIQICEDSKVKLNPNFIIDKYPLHTINEIFTVLHGGESFSELDLKHAYMQFPVKENCRYWLTIVSHKGLFPYTKFRRSFRQHQQTSRGR